MIPGTLNAVLTIAAASACCGALWAASHGSPWQMALAAIAFSYVNNTMFSLLHESVHGIGHANRRANEALGIFAAAFFPTSLSLQRVFHLAHHARNRTIDEQFDYIRPHDRPLLKRAQWYAILTGLYWLFVPLGGLAYLVWPAAFRIARRDASASQTGASSMFAYLDEAPRTRIRLELLFTIAMQVALFVVLDLNATGWLLCYAAFAVNWSSLQYTDHAFSKLDVRDGAWNLRVNALTRALFLNYHHHLAHHRHPHVPWLHLGRYIDPSEPRPSFWSIYLQMWRGPRRVGVRHQSGGFATALLYFPVIFAICYGGASWWTSTLPGPLPSWDFAFERSVPFVPWTAIVYLTITPVLLLAPWLLRERAPLFAFALSVETILATVCFLLFPQEVAWHRPFVSNWTFRLADAMNLSYNNFPSLHVAFAVSAAWAYRRLGWWLWAAAVALSTWLMWEHHLVDIVGGVALALIVMRSAESIWVELCCLVQCARFSRRHIRYFVIFLGIWGPSLLHWRRYRAVRYGFCAAQWIDDLLDGDRPTTREPLEVVADLQRSLSRSAVAQPQLWYQSCGSATALLDLTHAFFAEISPAAQTEFLTLIDCMRTDRMRVLHREQWTEQQLNDHHHRTFELSINLLLHTTHTTARAEQVPSLIDALAWCSVFRDLEEDQRKGLNNIPRGADVAEWTRTSHARALITLKHSAAEVAALPDPRARRILRIFQRSVEKFAGATAARTPLRMPQSNRDLPPHLRPSDAPPRPHAEPLPLEELPPPPPPVPLPEEQRLPDPFLRRT